MRQIVFKYLLSFQNTSWHEQNKNRWTYDNIMVRGSGEIQRGQGDYDSDEVSNIHKSANKNVETEYFFKIIFFVFFCGSGPNFNSGRVISVNATSNDGWMGEGWMDGFLSYNAFESGQKQFSYGTRLFKSDIDMLEHWKKKFTEKMYSWQKKRNGNSESALLRNSMDEN